MQRTGPILFVLALLTLMLGGCQTGRGPILTVLLGPLANKQLAQELKNEVYPADAPLGDDLDVVVQRKGTRLVLTNRTARRYEKSQLWLNQQYVGRVDRIIIGAGHKFNRYALADFINASIHSLGSGWSSCSASWPCTLLPWGACFEKGKDTAPSYAKTLIS